MELISETRFTQAIPIVSALDHYFIPSDSDLLTSQLTEPEGYVTASKVQTQCREMSRRIHPCTSDYFTFELASYILIFLPQLAAN